MIMAKGVSSWLFVKRDISVLSCCSVHYPWDLRWPQVAAERDLGAAVASERSVRAAERSQPGLPPAGVGGGPPSGTVGVGPEGERGSIGQSRVRLGGRADNRRCNWRFHGGAAGHRQLGRRIGADNGPIANCPRSIATK